MILLGKKTIAVAYIRVSTDKQEFGPDAQRKAIQDWATRTGTTVAAEFSDEDVSGAAPAHERPGLSQALVALRKHRAGVLVVAKRDRLARDIGVARQITDLARKAGAAVRSADGMSDVEGASGKLMNGVGDLFSEYERERIRERTVAALAVKRDRGEMTGQPPYGWRLKSAAATEKQLEPDPFEQWVLRRIHARRANGESLRAIAAALARSGVTSRRGTLLTHRQVGNALRHTPAEGLAPVESKEELRALRASYRPYVGRSKWGNE